MVKVSVVVGALMSVAAAMTVSATKINFINKCSNGVQLYHSERFEKLEKLADIDSGKSYSKDVTGHAHMFRDGFDTDATLVEFSMPSDSKAWYDISVIPPMPGHCRSFDDCKQVTGKRGFNRPVSIEPKANANGKNCRKLVCPADDQVACADAYHFPDDVKTHDCPASTEFDVVFCPDGGDNSGAYTPAQTSAPSPTKQNSKSGSSNNNNNNNNSQYGFGSEDLGGQSQGKVSAYESGVIQPTTAAPAAASSATPAATSAGSSKLGSVKTTYSYKGKEAGNMPGTYNRVTKLSGCVKEPVSVNSPVGPLCEEVGVVFRGPMNIFSIAVFDGSSGNGTFSRVSSYDRDTGAVENLVFMNNKNIDYTGTGKHGPQGFASEDGTQKAEQPKTFKGLLAEAKNPSQIGAGPGIQTGAEVNIMTGKKCNGDCAGYHGDNDYHGWGGGKKIFVTKVQMPQGSSPNQPAMWMLNAQVLHSNQYGCNCRGVGKVGGCGELDIAEVIETNDKRDKVSTHYYFYDGSVVAPNGDNFAPRPVDAPTVYITLIDEANGGLIKIMQVDDFDFSQGEVSNELYQQMVQA